MNENELGGNIGGTPTPTPQATQTPAASSGNQPEQRMYTKDQVTQLMKNRVNRSHTAFFKRYGVNNLDELDKLFLGTKENESLKNQIKELQETNATNTRTLAFLRNNIDENRYDDIVAHFKGTGKEFSEEALKELLQTHPEWLKQSNVASTNPSQNTGTQTTVTSLGVNSGERPSVDEKAIASKLFGVNL